MREIKFRGKNLSGKWLYGDLIHHVCNASIVSKIEMEEHPIDHIGALVLKNIVHSYTIGQLSGLPDRAGNEIWENDIVDAPYVDSIFRDVHPTARVKAVIRFVNGAFVVEYSQDCRIYLQDLHDKIEVVGNIHDNPELLEDI